MSKARLEIAVQAFADVERAQLLVDKKEKALSDALIGLPEELLPEYYKQTTEIEHFYEEKREEAGLD